MAGGKRTAKESLWREILGRQAASGLSVRAFCRQEGIGEASFYYWRRAIRPAETGPPTPAPAFVPAMVRGAPLREAPILIEWDAGPRLRLPGTISAAWVAELLRAVATGGGR